MKWKCINDIKDERLNTLFKKGLIYEEQDDRGEAEDIAICLMSEQKHKVYLANQQVRENFNEIPRRRNLSGIYIFEQFTEESKRQPTCFEDCDAKTQKKWLNELEKEALINLALKLGETIKNIGDSFDIVAR